MPHSAAPSSDTLASFTSEDFEVASIAVAQAAQKHHSTVLNIPTRRESMATVVPSANDFSFVQQPLPSLPTPPEARPLRREKSTPSLHTRPTTASSDATAVPADHDPRHQLHSPQSHLHTQPQSQSQSQSQSLRRLQSLATRDPPPTNSDHPSHGGHISSARERVTRDAPVIAELRTNVIINDEYTLTTDLSYHLSTRYQRPESSIAVTIQHSACLCLGGSFQPAYLLTITALSDLIQPAANKRNTALIQSFMSDTLAVPADRGIIRYLPMPEENIAINSRTILDEIEKLEKLHAEERKALTQGRRLSPDLRRARSNERQTPRQSPHKTIPNSIPNMANGTSRSMPGSSAGLGISSSAPPSAYPNDAEAFDGTGVLINGRGAVIDNVNHISPGAAAAAAAAAVAAPPQPSPVDSKMGSPVPQGMMTGAGRMGASSMRQVDMGTRGKLANGGAGIGGGSLSKKDAAKRLPLTPSDMPHIPPPPPPPIPVDDERTERARRLGKRRSIISIFSRK